MRKFFVVLTTLGTISTPLLAQPPVQSVAPKLEQPAQPQLVKKRVCTKSEPMTGSRIGTKKLCKTIEVAATEPATADNEHHAHDEGSGTH